MPAAGTDRREPRRPKNRNLVTPTSGRCSVARVQITSVPFDDPLVRAAAGYAAAAHLGQTRKGGEFDYFEHHLVPVARLVADHGGDAVQVAAAYLHDTAEDCGGQARLDHVIATFGTDVGRIVADLSDSLAADESAKAPWRVRKEAYVDALATKPRRSLEVAVADKCHNASAILDDLARHGDALWARFTVSDPAAHCWYYGAIVDALDTPLNGHPLLGRLRAMVEDLVVATRTQQLGAPI